MKSKIKEIVEFAQRIVREVSNGAFYAARWLRSILGEGSYEFARWVIAGA